MVCSNCVTSYTSLWCTLMFTFCRYNSVGKYFILKLAKIADHGEMSRFAALSTRQRVHVYMIKKQTKTFGRQKHLHYSTYTHIHTYNYIDICKTYACVYVINESSYFVHGTKHGLIERIELNSTFPFFSKSTRHFVVVVKVKYVCKIMNLMLVTL